MYPRVSLTFSIFTRRLFFFLFLPASSIKRTHFFPLLHLAFTILVQPNQAHSVIRVSYLSPSFFSPFLSFSFTCHSFSVQLAWILSDTLVVSRTQSCASSFSPSPPFPTPCPYLRPWPSCVHACRLSPSIASVYTRALPLFVASSDEHEDRVCA